MRVLIAEDERRLADAIARGLRREGMAVDLAPDGADALVKARGGRLDVRVPVRAPPGGHGDDVCLAVGDAGPGIPPEEHERIFEFLKKFPVRHQLRIFSGGERIQLVDANQSMLVGGVAMKKFVLHEAGELSELGQISPEKIDTMHHAQHAANLAFASWYSFSTFS